MKETLKIRVEIQERKGQSKGRNREKRVKIKKLTSNREVIVVFGRKGKRTHRLGNVVRPTLQV